MEETKARMPEKLQLIPLGQNTTGLGIILTAMALLGLGVVVVHTAVASVGTPGAWYARVDFRHTIFAAVAGLILLTTWRFNYRIFSIAVGGKVPWIALGILVVSLGLGVLVFVPGVGHAVGGKFRWLRIGPRQYSIGLQPSEFIKFALVIFLAAFLSHPQRNVRSIWVFLICCLAIGASTLLIVTQDFGTSVLIALTSLIMLFIVGVPFYYLLPTIALGGWVGYYFIISTPYRLNRVLAMIDPWSQTNPAAFHARQSILSILNGGWTGVGLGNGVRKLGFLPEDSTDFIFATFCEELGFRGALLLLGLLLLWIYQCRNAATKTSDPFGKILAASLGILITLQALLHIGVNIVALPPTGISMPFISAGGTSLILMTAATGIIVSITSRRPAETPEEIELQNSQTSTESNT
jgi:cell division protein FtsW